MKSGVKKRYVLKNKRKFYSIIMTLSIVLTTVFFAVNAYGYEGKSYETVTVQKGDTLWAIAEKYCERGDIRRFIYEIKRANNMKESVIYAGEALKIPA